MATLATAALIALLGSCVPAPAPAPAPPAPPPRPAYVPPPPPPPVRDWHDAALSPGDWHWASDAAGGRAWYGAGDSAELLSLRCTRAGGEVTLRMAGAPMGRAGALALTIATTTRTLATTAAADGHGAAVLRLPAYDAMLDAMAFSRGRFMIAAEGIGSVIVPSWPEVARVIEDCRAAGAMPR